MINYIIMVVIIFDLETSGLNPYHNDIIEIGAKVLDSEKTFSCLVRPKSNRLIDKKITEITGITNRTLRAEGKQWLQAYNDFYNWLVENLEKDEKNAIVSHNGEAFDFIFLKRILNDLRKNNKLSIDIHDRYELNYIDTLLLSKRLLSDSYTFKQESLCKYFNIKIDISHRAMNDVLNLEQLYIKLLDLLENEKKEEITIELVKNYIQLMD